jgi:hypothetical protein
MLIKVKVFPGEKKEIITKKTDDSFEVKIKEDAERGEANKRVKEVLALHLHVPAGKIRLIKGSRSRSKIFNIIK